MPDEMTEKGNRTDRKKGISERSLIITVICRGQSSRTKQVRLTIKIIGKQRHLLTILVV